MIAIILLWRMSVTTGYCVIHPCSRESLTDRLFDRDHAYDAVSEHNRRPHYWEYYHLAHSGEIAFLIEMIATLIRESPCRQPRQAEQAQGGRDL